VNGPDPQKSNASANILIPKAVGWLNIALSLMLMGCGTCYIAYTVAIPGFDNFIREAQKQTKEDARKKRDNEIAALKKQQTQAATEQEKEEIGDQIKAVPEAPDMPFLEIGAKHFGLDNPRVLGHFAADASSGLLLNLLLLISGIGLVRCKEWGRKMAIGVAAAKILRHVILSISAIFVMSPVLLGRTDAFFKEQATARTAEAKATGEKTTFSSEEAADLSRELRSAVYAAVAYILIVGSVYPVLTLVVLTRPSAKAACSRKSKLAPV
jgi:uncharacterized protein YxeA